MDPSYEIKSDYLKVSATIADTFSLSGDYAFGRGMASKLAVNPRFRQFDRWFLDSGKPGNVDYSMSLRGPLRAPTLGVEPNRRR